MSGPEFYQKQDGSIWFSFAFATHVIDRPKVPQDEIDYPVLWGAFQIAKAGSTEPVQVEPPATIVTDPQAETPIT